MTNKILGGRKRNANNADSANNANIVLAYGAFLPCWPSLLAFAVGSAGPDAIVGIQYSRARR